MNTKVGVLLALAGGLPRGGRRYVYGGGERAQRVIILRTSRPSYSPGRSASF